MSWEPKYARVCQGTAAPSASPRATDSMADWKLGTQTGSHGNAQPVHQIQNVMECISSWIMAILAPSRSATALNRSDLFTASMDPPE